MDQGPRIAVIGLGYVGLPLALALARHFAVTGYDRDAGRVAEIAAGHDRTGEIAAAALTARPAGLVVSAEPGDLDGHDLFIVAVPTPVDDDRAPDLGPVEGACRTVGRALAPGATVVLESTVYPGVTEDICGPVLEAASGLRAGLDFHLGYSPERINPGDPAHGLGAVTKVVAGDGPATVALLERVYGAATGGNVFVARDIRTAEAAKVIENAQRDINIAFVNEVAMIFGRLGLDSGAVLEAARTKWNFLDFRPGLVGGHCIGVDPYYLAAAARAAGHEPEIILAGRRLNDGMASYVAGRVLAGLARDAAGARILVLGLAFKENVPDLRNSQAAGLVAALAAAGCDVAVHDALADAAEARRLYGIDLAPTLDGLAGFDAVVAAVGHQAYGALDGAALARLVRDGGLVADVKHLWDPATLPPGRRVWRL